MLGGSPDVLQDVSGIEMCLHIDHMRVGFHHASSFCELKSFHRCMMYIDIGHKCILETPNDRDCALSKSAEFSF